LGVIVDHLTITGGPVLAFDVALQSCGVCVFDPQADRALSQIVETMTRGQSERLAPMAGEALALAGVGYSDIRRIVTTIGPGSFTGLRVGLSMALALGMALDIPVAGVLVSDAIAMDVLSQNKGLGCNLVVLIETKRADFYVHEFNDEGHSVSPCAVMNLEDLRAHLSARDVALCGDGVMRFEHEIRAVGTWPDAWRVLSRDDVPQPQTLARLANDPEKCHPPKPLYLREADVTLSNKVRRVLAEG